MTRPGSLGSPDSPEIVARIEAAMALISPVAKQLKTLLSAGIAEDELISFGSEGALAAGRTFDPSRGVPFERWATLKVRGRILDELRTKANMPRRFHGKLRAALAAHDMEEGALEDGAPRVPETAEQADERLSSHLAAMATAMALGCLHTSDDEVLGGIEDARGSPEDQAIREELKARVHAAIAEQPEKERMVLENYYFGDQTLEQAAGGLSRSWASRLLARGTEGVARALQRSSDG